MNQGEAWMLTVLQWQVQFLVKEPAGLFWLLGVRAASVTAPCKTNAERCFCFLTFFLKMRIFSSFLRLKISFG